MKIPTLALMWFWKKPKPRPRTPTEIEVDALKAQGRELAQGVHDVRCAVEQLELLAGRILESIDELKLIHEHREAVAALGVQDVQATEHLN